MEHVETSNSCTACTLHVHTQKNNNNKMAAWHYLVVVGHDPTQTLCIAFRYLLDKTGIFTGDSKLLLIVSLLPSCLPQSIVAAIVTNTQYESKVAHTLKCLQMQGSCTTILVMLFVGNLTIQLKIMVYMWLCNDHSSHFFSINSHHFQQDYCYEDRVLQGSP